MSEARFPGAIRYDESTMWTEEEIEEIIDKYWNADKHNGEYTLKRAQKLYDILNPFFKGLDTSIHLPSDLSKKHKKTLGDMAYDWALFSLQLHIGKGLPLTEKRLADMFNIAMDHYEGFYPDEVEEAKTKKAEALAELRLHHSDSKKRKHIEGHVRKTKDQPKRRCIEKEKEAKEIEIEPKGNVAVMIPQHLFSSSSSSSSFSGQPPLAGEKKEDMDPSKNAPGSYM